MQAIGHHCNQLQSLNLGWCEQVSDVGVMSLAYGCPDLRTLDLCGCVLITGILFEIAVLYMILLMCKFHLHAVPYLLELSLAYICILQTLSSVIK